MFQNFVMTKEWEPCVKVNNGFLMKMCEQNGENVGNLEMV